MAQTNDIRGETPGTTPPRPTLLVFTLGAAGDRARRRLLPAAFSGVEAALHQACLDAALAAGRAVGCDLAVATCAPLDLPADVQRIAQHGASFGERFRHAVADAERTARGPLLVVGTDVPDLDARHMREALDRLGKEDAAGSSAQDATTPVIVGPATDGGFYLLASATPIAPLLECVRWCRRDTLRTLVSSLADAGLETRCLESLADLDHRRALERWIAGRRRLPRGHRGALRILIARLARVLAALYRPAAPRTRTTPSLLLRTPFGGRAPPLVG